jgi:hypothetical protein
MEFRQHKREYYIRKLGYAQVTPAVLKEQVNLVTYFSGSDVVSIFCQTICKKYSKCKRLFLHESNHDVAFMYVQKMVYFSAQK